MNLADPELELIDPTPNIHGLFVHFDELFFFTKLMGRALVRWSKRMYSCAGVCSYEGRNGICDIALSEPLLKLRPRKDLIETLLHEMIHAFLFITNKDSDRDGHGPNFKAHMYRINKAAGLNISIYHSFHDEVNLYLKHWWRCNGRCQKMKPYFGVVRRSCNRAPGPSDHWWVAHKRICGGTFIKIKEPEKTRKPPAKKDKGKAMGNITKYINNNNPNTENKNLKSVDNKTTPTKTSVEVVVSSAGPNLTTVPDIGVFIEGSKRKRSNSNPVIEKVRDVWKNKHLPTSSVNITRKVPDKVTSAAITKKHRTDSGNVASPPNKVKKIDDYFKTTASSILKDVYGKEFIISQSGDSKKFKAITVGDSDCNKVGPVNEMEDFVKCPSCNIDVRSKYINRHLDECLNKDIIESLTKKSIQSTPKLKDVVGDIQTIPPFKFKTDNNHIAVQKDNKIITIEASDGNSKTYKNISKTKTEKDNFNMEIKAKPGTSKDFEPQKCPCCGNMVYKSMNKHLDECLGFFDNNTTVPEEGTSAKETVVIQDSKPNTNIKSEPSTSKDLDIQKCPCCGNKIETPIELHLDECLGFFDNNTTIPIEGGSAIETIVIDDDDDDIFDESQTFNPTGTKSPCPCCLKMVENEDMNDHLDVCLGT